MQQELQLPLMKGRGIEGGIYRKEVQSAWLLNMLEVSLIEVIIAVSLLVVDPENSRFCSYFSLFYIPKQIICSIIWQTVDAQ